MKKREWVFFKPVFEYEQAYTDLGGPWSGHKYFAYDLIKHHAPKQVVELGTHLGCSLFSMAQAVKDFKLNTKLDAVDTWKGDEHAGFYPEEIFKRVQEIRAEFYPKLKINLVRSTFGQAVKKYKNKSIDLLHIDGRHTYEDVKEDFETWFDKVSDDGIILFHDISVRQWGFGIYKLWEELKKKYKTIEFGHSFGLGVLYKNPKMFDQDLMKLLPQKYFLTAKYKQISWNCHKIYFESKLKLKKLLAI